MGNLFGMASTHSYSNIDAAVVVEASNIPDNERIKLLERREGYLRPLSFAFRLRHSLLCIFGGMCFLLGSYQYMPWVENEVAGGWLFTVGSMCFFCADFQNWWNNNRVGCAFDSEFRDDYEAAVGHGFLPATTLLGQFQRAENGLNYFMTTVGSLMYFIGCVMFLPRLHAIVAGDIVFIPGSLVLMSAESWKIVRAGCKDANNTADKNFKWSNLVASWTSVLSDALLGTGAVLFLIGSIFFLPSNEHDESDLIRAVSIFIAGSVLFTMSGLVLFYRYFFTNNYPH